MRKHRFFLLHSGLQSQNKPRSFLALLLRMTSKTGFFAAAQNDKLKPVILRVVPSPEGSGVVLGIEKNRTRSFAAVQDGKAEPGPSRCSRRQKTDPSSGAFRPWGKNLPSRRNPPLSEILQKYDKMLYVYSERRR